MESITFNIEENESAHHRVEPFLLFLPNVCSHFNFDSMCGKLPWLAVSQVLEVVIRLRSWAGDVQPLMEEEQFCVVPEIDTDVAKCVSGSVSAQSDDDLRVSATDSRE